ncbi:hypothetical protein ACWDZ8_05905 [Streptomyces sp. NPDC003233]
MLKCSNEKAPGGLSSIWLTPAQKLTQPSTFPLTRAQLREPALEPRLLP